MIPKNGLMRSAEPAGTIDRAPSDSGSYLLAIRIERTIDVRVGKKGVFRFYPGYAFYAGNARNGLSARIERHKRKRKPRHRHIDYLVCAKGVEIIDVLKFPARGKEECELVKRLLSLPGAKVAVPGFGASDCVKGCPAHLVWFEKRPAGLETLLGSKKDRGM